MKLSLILPFLVLVLFSNAQSRTATQSKTVVSRTVIAKVPVDSSRFYRDTIIKWMTVEEADAAQKVKPKKILVDVYATWCRWCRVEDSTTFRNREIAHYINQNFYPVKFNAENRTPVTFKGKKYVFLSEESKWVHEFAQYVLNYKLSYPGLAFIDEKGTLIESKNGYMDAPYLEVILNYYGSSAYKKMNYRDFDYDFEGKLSKE